MSRGLLLIALVAVSVSGACTCPSTPCALSAPVASEDVVFLAGSTARATFTHEIPSGCEERLAVERVSAEVVDEDNAKVPTTATFETLARDRQLRVDVDFQTAKPGWYHLSALLDPGIAVVQSELLVAADRTAVAPIEVPTACTRAQRTTSGTVFCDGASFRDGGFTSELEAQVLDVQGDVAWGWTGSRIERVRDSAAGLQREPATGFAQPTRPLVLVTSADGSELFAATSAEVFRLAYRNGALTELSRTPLGTVLTADLGFVSAGTFFLFDAPALPTITSKTRVCGYSLANDLLTKLQTCQEVIGLPLGVGDDGVWFREEGIARVWRGSAQGELKPGNTLRLPELGVSGVTAPKLQAPVVGLLRPDSKSWLSLRAVNGRLFFDRYRIDPGFTLSGASPTTVFTAGNGRTRIFAR